MRVLPYGPLYQAYDDWRRRGMHGVSKWQESLIFNNDELRQEFR